MEVDLTKTLTIGDIVPTRENAFAKVVSLSGPKGRPIVTIIVDPLTGREGVVKQHRKDGRIYTGYNKSAYDLMADKIATPVWVALDKSKNPLVYMDEVTAQSQIHLQSTKLVKIVLFAKDEI
jgi:hypothetical protein